MLDMMRGLGPKQQEYLLTGDESWIYWDNHCGGMWAQDRDELPPNEADNLVRKYDGF
jgi:hypothetical protein